MTEGPKTIYSTASRKKKWLTSLSVFYCTFTLGINMTFLNPTLLDFEKKLGEDVDTLSLVFTISTATAMVGALVGGIILPYMNRQIWVIICLILLVAPFVAIPFVTTKILLFVCAGFMGFGVGGYDCAQVAWIIDIWRHDAAPFILSQHFAFSLGTVVPSLLLAPFLTEKPVEKEDDVTTTPFTTSTELPYESKLATPFLIASGFMLISVLIQIAVWFMYRSASPEKSEAVADKVDVDQLEKKNSVVGEDLKSEGKQDSLKRRIYLIFLCACVLGFYQGLEICTGQFLPTFSHFSEVGFSEAQGARLSTALQLSFAAGRLAGIVLVLRIAPLFLISGSFVILLVANTLFLTLGGSSATWLWVAAVVMGVGQSTFFPAVYAFVERYIFVTDSFAAVITISGGFVSGIYPIIVSRAVENNPEMMTYVNYLSLGVCGVAFFLLFWFTQVRAKRLARAS